ncbi:TonB-dependent receptor [Phenylobacterium sp. Root700]|uniref:TonB-dependent receptor n=1 Tax=Phenylobacterium sp. Root700 TaxID=1736591 RepID=UPI000700FF0D|nr:TonB-dependent receptor [Phenylobacterium sp. Root700]KRB42461.1 hypothetical protein ASE02_21240 [Phenylobacterium sp. Root700]
MTFPCGSGAQRRALMILALASSALTSLPLAAAAATPTDESLQISEVVVTATRREARLQDVPLAVTAVSGEELRRSNYTALADVQYLAPGVTFSSEPAANAGGFQIRGVGTQAYNYGTEQTVGMVVDDVVIGMPRDPGVAGFGDIERIEVLRGPQGTLFGKNSSAGVVAITTVSPKLGQFGANAHLAYGSREEVVTQAAVNLPLTETLAARISAFYQKQDGAIPNLLNDWRAGDRNGRGVYAKLLWEPNDRFSFQVAAQQQRLFSRDPVLVQSLGFNPLFAAAFTGLPTPAPDRLVSYQNDPYYALTRVSGLSGKATYKLGDYSLTSVTAYRRMRLQQRGDVDAAPVNIMDYFLTSNWDEQFTQEFRLTSPAGERLEYVAGAYYYDVDVRADETAIGYFFQPVRVSLTGGGTNHYKVRTRSTALFGQGTYRLTDDLRLIGGLRYTHDQISANVDITPIPGIIPLNITVPATGKVEHDNISGRVGFQYDFAPDVMAYASYATGYKGPSVNVIQGQARSLKPETSESYELGLKSSLLDRRVILNTALYWSTYKDFQAQTYDTTLTFPTLILANAGELRSRGVEVELTGKVTSNLTVSANGAFSEATYRDFTSTCYPGEPISAQVGVGCYVDPRTGAQVANMAGRRLPNSPKWTYSIGANYSRPVGNGLEFDLNANWGWRGAVFNRAGDPTTKTPDYGLLGMSAGIGDEDGRWRVGVYGRNLLDTLFVSPVHSVADPGGFNRFISNEAFRTVGVSLDVRY